MRNYINSQQNESRTLDNTPKASKQAPVSEILQTYKEQPIHSEIDVTGYPIVQRKIGFEFQTGWTVRQRNGPSWTRLDKGQKWNEGNNFTVEADDSSNPDISQVEFVTKPLNSLKSVHDTMRGLHYFAQEMIIDSKGAKEKYNSGIYEICPNGVTMQAIPQASFGLQLKKLVAVQNLTSKIINFAKIPKNLKPNMNATIKDVSTTSIDGVVGLIKAYIDKSKVWCKSYTYTFPEAENQFVSGYPLRYPKQITDGGLLARTQFTKLFELALQQDGQQKNSFMKADWLGRFSEYDLDEPLFSHEVLTDYEKTIPDATKGEYFKANILLIGSWLSTIYDESNDWLTAVKDHESLGALGDKTETVAGVESGIFESRLHAPILGYAEWYDYADVWTKYIIALSGADPNDLSQPAPAAPAAPAAPVSEDK